MDTPEVTTIATTDDQSPSVSENPLPKPGWYRDPQNSRRLRWWDGSAWTLHTHQRQQMSVVADLSGGVQREPAAGRALDGDSARPQAGLQTWFLTLPSELKFFLPLTVILGLAGMVTAAMTG